MIAYLSGRLIESSVDAAIIDCNGIGYRALCSAKTLAALPGTGEVCRLYTELHIREDAHVLYGFLTADEQHWFRILNNVQGVGGRVALAILSTLDPAHILTALATGDKAAFQRADGVGPKLALRLVTELKDKAKGFSAAPVIPFARASTSKTAADPAGDAVSALINLGYARVQAFTAVQQALASGSAANDTGVLVTAALRQLSDAG